MAANERLYRKVLQILLASPSDPDCEEDIRDLLRQLGRRTCKDFRIDSAHDLEHDLSKCNKLFELQRVSRREVLVSPRTSLTFCRRHSTESGSCPEGTCSDLHFCLFFLLSGECRYGADCLFGHRLGSHHNQRLLQRHLLQGLNITELRTLFTLPRVRQGLTLPRVCRYYNVARGCNKGMGCRSLHLCWHYVRQQCKFGVGCSRNHDINQAQVINVLTLYGVEVRGRQLSDLLQEVRTYNRRCEEEEDEEEEDEEEEVHARRSRSGRGDRARRSASVPSLRHRMQVLSIPDPYDRHMNGQRDARETTPVHGALVPFGGYRPQVYPTGYAPNSRPPSAQGITYPWSRQQY